MKNKKTSLKRSLGLSFLLGVILLIVTACDSGEVKDQNEEIKEPQEKDLVEEEVEFSHVIDGNLIVVNGSKGEETIRLAHILAPELDMPYGEKAKEFIEENIQKDLILIRGNPEKDKYGNTIGYINFFTEEGVIFYLNQAVVGNGYAIGMIQDEQQYITYRNNVETLHVNARVNAKGVFSINGYVTPEGYDMSVFEEGYETMFEN